MPEISFVFGPQNSFFFDCPQTWRYHNLPHTLRQLFDRSMSPAWRVAHPYCLALAPQTSSPEPVWYVGCKVLDGGNKLFYSQDYFDINYPDLARWIKSFPHASASCFVTFGQRLSYFACAPGQGSIWAGIPSDLEDKVRKSIETPCCVSLGMKDAWFLLYPNGYVAWKFNGQYSALNKVLLKATPGSISYAAISPYNKDHYFIAFHDRSVNYNFKGAPLEWTKLMTEVFDLWAAERMRMQHQPNLLSTVVPFPQHQSYPPVELSSQPDQEPPYPQGQLQSKAQSPYDGALPANPSSPSTVPNTPLPSYRSPVVQHLAPATLADHKVSQELLPVELFGDTQLSTSTPVPNGPNPAEKKKKKKFFSRLF